MLVLVNISHDRRTLLFLTIKWESAKFVPQKVEGKEHRSKSGRWLHIMLLCSCSQNGRMVWECDNTFFFVPGRGGFLLVIQICKCPSTCTDAGCVPSFGIHKQLWRPHQLDGADSKTQKTKPQTSKWGEREDRDSTSQETCKLNQILPPSLPLSLPRLSFLPSPFFTR